MRRRKIRFGIYNKMFFSMLLTALIPLLMLSIYVSARYYHKTAATVLRQNQLVEESLG